MKKELNCDTHVSWILVSEIRFLSFVFCILGFLCLSDHSCVPSVPFFLLSVQILSKLCFNTLLLELFWGFLFILCGNSCFAACIFSPSPSVYLRGVSSVCHSHLSPLANHPGASTLHLPLLYLFRLRQPFTSSALLVICHNPGPPIVCFPSEICRLSAKAAFFVIKISLLFKLFKSVCMLGPSCWDGRQMA